MPRRASFTIHPGWIVAILILVLVAIAGGYFLVGRVNDPYRTLSPLDVASYLENSNSLRGNTYKVSGAVWNSLGWSSTAGRLFSVEVDNRQSGSDRSSGSDGVDVLPLLIPPEFNAVNVQKGQRFIFKVEVDEKGILKASGLTKV